ncbi:MAG TPA: AraC family transcriptional regulator [Thermoanaerobaculia bacterium]|nr:AraC family transcriptional regulator [Thermoanaerobaculia bacterium]
MFQIDTLIRTSMVTVLRTAHLPGMIRYGTEEENEATHDVTFLEAGGLGVGTGDQECFIRDGGVLVQRPGTVYRYTHTRNEAPDVCLTVRFAEEFDNACDRELATCGIAPRVTNRLAYLRWRLSSLLGTDDAIELDCWTADILGALRDSVGDTDRLHRPSQLRWYSERVEAVRSMLEERYSERHSLASMASSVAISPFQFARIFRRFTGRPPHQYLLQVRLEAARRMLLDGAAVTDVCYDSGFFSLSHFIHVFKRRFGCTPSAVRRQRHLQNRSK